MVVCERLKSNLWRSIFETKFALRCIGARIVAFPVCFLLHKTVMHTDFFMLAYVLELGHTYQLTIPRFQKSFLNYVHFEKGLFAFTGSKEYIRTQCTNTSSILFSI